MREVTQDLYFLVLRRDTVLRLVEWLRKLGNWVDTSDRRWVLGVFGEVKNVSAPWWR